MLEPEDEVFLDGAVRKQGVVLEEESHASKPRGNVDFPCGIDEDNAIEGDSSAVRALEPRDAP